MSNIILNKEHRNLDGKWMFSIYESDTWYSDEFGSKEECIKAAKEEYETWGDVEGFYIGKCLGRNISEIVSPESILENIVETAGDNDGYEFTESWGEELIKHSDSFGNMLEKWATENNLQPSYYIIENVEYVEMKGQRDDN